MLANPAIVISLIATPLLLLLGGWMLRSALVGVRRGETRFCAKCGYDLTGATGEVCSECGNRLRRQGGIVIGVRRVQRGLLCFSALLFVLALGIGVCAAVIVAKQVTWYSIAPLYFVLQDARHDNPTIKLDALRELAKRQSAKPFAKSDALRIADLLVAKLTPKSPASHIALDLLIDFDATDRLTDEQRATFIDKSVRFSLIARSPVLPGRSVPMVVTLESDLYPDRYTYSGEFGSFRLGEHLRAGAVRYFSGESFSRITEFDAIVAAPGPGWHVATASVKYSVHRAKYAGSKRSATPIMGNFGPSIHDGTRDVKAEVKVLDVDAPSPIAERRDDALVERLTKCFRPTQLAAATSEFSDSGVELAGFITIERLPPLPVAFDVFVRVHGIEYAAGNFICVTGHDALEFWKFSVSDWKHGAAQPVTIVLRANPRLVEETIDVFEVWMGELMFPDVPVADRRLPATKPDLGKLIDLFSPTPVVPLQP